MTSQKAGITIANNQIAKDFETTITDAVWSNLPDTLSGSNLGILIPNAMINRGVGTYQAGVGAWRIINAQTLAVSRRGWLGLRGYSCYKSGEFATHRVGPNEIVQGFTLPSDATSAKANVIGWVHTTKGTELYKATAVDDNTATEIKTALQDQTVGDAAFNSNMTGLSIQVEDGGQLTSVLLYDSAGGLVWQARGNHRGTNNGGTSAYYNFKAEGLSIPIGKGFSLKVTTVTA